MKQIEKALKDKQALAISYNVPLSAIIWKGNNKYIVIKDGKQIEI